jgi:hypothetical protein
MGAITSEEKAHDKERQNDEAPEEIEEARSDQTPPPESLLIARKEFVRGVSAQPPEKMLRAPEHAYGFLRPPTPISQGLPAAKRRPYIFPANKNTWPRGAKPSPR